MMFRAIGLAALMIVSAGVTGAVGADNKPEDQVRAASKQFYAALNDMLNGDAGPLADVWSHSETVTTMHPIGGRQVGWDQVWQSWENVAKLASDGHVELKDSLIRVNGNLAYEVGTEEGAFKLAGHEIPAFAERVTNIYEREGGTWKVVHHHVDVSKAMQDVLAQLPPPAEGGK